VDALVRQQQWERLLAVMHSDVDPEVFFCLALMRIPIFIMLWHLRRRLLCSCPA
jgi:hypothetical protein